MVDLWPLSWHMEPPSGRSCFLFAGELSQKFPAPPFAIHRHPSSIAKAGYLGRTTYFPPKKMGKNWEEKSSSATHTLKKKNLVNVNYGKTILHIKVKVGADFAWSF